MKTFHINGRKSYYVCTTIEAEDEQEAANEFQKVELEDCDEVCEEASFVEEIFSDEDEEENEDL